MLKKRIVGVITIKNGWAVQSFGYGRYLPLGRPETIATNLDRWGVDEVLVQCIDRYETGPDFALLESLCSQGLSTPLVYSGGILTTAHAVSAIQSGADRVCVDSLLHEAPSRVMDISAHLGAQGVIACLPLSIGEHGVMWLDHRMRINRPLDPVVMAALREGAVSEALVIDWKSEGILNSFDGRLLLIEELAGIPIIAFGGLSKVDTMRSALSTPNVTAIAQGNFLNYREHAVQALRNTLAGSPIRIAHYAASPL